jgi:hypothetical protein
MIINSTLYSAKAGLKKRVGYVIDDDGTAYVNLDFIGPKFITYLNASYDGIEIITIKGDLFAPRDWALTEVTKSFKGDKKALATINGFFKTLDENRDVIRSAYHA